MPSGTRERDWCGVVVCGTSQSDSMGAHQGRTLVLFSAQLEQSLSPIQPNSTHGREPKVLK